MLTIFSLKLRLILWPPKLKQFRVEAQKSYLKKSLASLRRPFIPDTDENAMTIEYHRCLGMSWFKNLNSIRYSILFAVLLSRSGGKGWYIYNTEYAAPLALRHTGLSYFLKEAFHSWKGPYVIHTTCGVIVLYKSDI